jgi:hypothetical protein
MKISFRLLSAFVLFAIVFSSCQKELSFDTTGGSGGGNNGGGGNTGGGSAYYIRGKKDGTAFNFTVNTMAKITDIGQGIVSLSLIASAGGSNMEGINIGINFANGKSPAVGTYSEDDSSLDYSILGVYNPNSTTIVYGAGVFSPSAKPLVVKILSKTNTEMTGTFEGAFYKTELSSGTIGPDFISFTEGEFKLKIQ